MHGRSDGGQGFRSSYLWPMSATQPNRLTSRRYGYQYSYVITCVTQFRGKSVKIMCLLRNRIF